MTTLRYITFFVLALVLFSCSSGTDNKTATENNPATLTSLAGQIYFYAPQLDTLTCKATGACDCCSGNIIFLNDSIFVSADYCESSVSYGKGKYHFRNGDLIITSDSLYINKEYDLAQEPDSTESTLPKCLITDTTTATSTQTLKRIQCKNTICFLMGTKEKYYVTPDNETKMDDFIKKLKEDKIWDRLKIKNYP